MTLPALQLLHRQQLH